MSRSLWLSHSLLCLYYWPNESLMDLVGSVQTLWDSGLRALITPQSPPSSFSLSFHSYFLCLTLLLLYLHRSPPPPGLVFLSSLFSAAGSFTHPSSCDRDKAVHTCVWMCYRQILTVSLVLVLSQTLKSIWQWPHLPPPHPHTLGEVLSHIHAKAESGLNYHAAS